MFLVLIVFPFTAKWVIDLVFLLSLGQVWLLLWVAIDGWDRLWVVVVVDFSILA